MAFLDQQPLLGYPVAAAVGLAAGSGQRVLRQCRW